MNQLNIGNAREQETYLIELRQRKKFEYKNSSPEGNDIIKMLKGDLDLINSKCKNWQQQLVLNLLTQET